MTNTKSRTAKTFPALTVEQALEIIRAKSARWAATFNPQTCTVECIVSDWVRRPNGTIIGANSGQGSRSSKSVLRPVVEVAAELVARDAARATRVASQRALMEQDIAVAERMIVDAEAQMRDLTEALASTNNVVVRRAIEIGMTAKGLEIEASREHIARIRAGFSE